MNNYARQAMAYWQKSLPRRYDQLPDAERFFTELGQRVERLVTELAERMAGQSPLDESDAQRSNRLDTARARAENIVLCREVLLEPEPTPNPRIATPDRGQHMRPVSF